MIGLPENRGGHGEYEVNELQVSVDDLYAPSSCVEESHNAQSKFFMLDACADAKLPGTKMFVDSCLDALPSSTAYVDGRSQ